MEIQSAAKQQVDLQQRLQNIDEELEQEGLNKKRLKALEAERISVADKLETIG